MFISSSPMLSDLEDFGLEDIDKNKAKLESLKQGFTSRKIATYKSKTLMEYTKSATESAIVMEADGQIIYYVALVKQRLKPLQNESTTQVELWRDISYSQFNKGLPEFVFQKVLMPRTDYIVSDEVQTGDGKKFWLTMLSVLAYKGHRVGVITNVSDVEWAAKEDIQAWLRLWSTRGYSKSTSGMVYRFVVKT